MTAATRPTPRLRAAQLRARPADVVLDPDEMGTARYTRHSFNRAFLRAAARERWAVDRTVWELDGSGRGRFAYRMQTPTHRFHLVGFSQVVDESQRTDRVVAEVWDVTAALVEGELTGPRLAALAAEVPRQEAGRAGADTLVWTRANRSARFFDALVQTLAAGRQPGPDDLGDAAYVLRSTAFYGNGKFGMAAFEAYPPGHPLRPPYRAQMLTAWLLREFSYDLVEHCARAQSPAAARLQGQWRRHLGLGNATGLGMVPYVVNHPRILDAWCALRELPLAAVLDRVPRPGDLDRVHALLCRAATHFAERAALPTAPYTAQDLLAAGVARVADHVARYRDTGRVDGAVAARPWAALRALAAAEGGEVRGVLDTVLVEIDDGLDGDVEQLLRCDEEPPWDPGTRCAEALARLRSDYAWVAGIDLRGPAAAARFWFTSADNEEPRRGRRGTDPGEDVEHALGVARDMSGLLDDLAAAPPDATLAQFLLGAPWHRGVLVRALGLSGVPYGEVRTNLLAADFLPLHLQRFQLAVYGMENFSPQSTDWLRVTLYSGAPRAAEVRRGVDDDWLFPLKPRGEHHAHP